MSIQGTSNSQMVLHLFHKQEFMRQKQVNMKVGLKGSFNKRRDTLL